MIIRYGKGRVGKVTNPGEMITFSKSGALKMNSAEIDDTVLTVIFSQNAFYNEGGFSNGLELTNTTTAEVAGIIAMSGSGTGEAMVVVSWITHPVLGDLLTLTYDGSDGIKDADDVDMEAQTIPCHNVLNEAPVNTSPPVISGTTYEGSILSCAVGAWDNGVSTYTYDWERDGVSTGQSSNNYLVELDDAGASMTCDVTATNAIGSNVATSNTLVMDGDVVGIAANVITHDFQGYSRASVSSITPVIEYHSLTGSAPCLIDVSALGSTAVGTNPNGENVNPHLDIEWSWLCTYADGSAITDKTGGTYNPVNGRTINLYADQVKPKASFVIEDLDPNDYLITLTGRAPDGSGGFTTATTSITFTTSTPATRQLHVWSDGVGGSNSNNGYDAWGLVYSDGAYNNTTGAFTSASGAFASFTPRADTYPCWERDNWLYIDDVCRRVEKVSDTEVTIALEDRDVGIPATGNTSVVTNGPQQTPFLTSFDDDNTTHHINGNAGSSVYEMATGRVGKNADGQSNYWCYNGDSTLGGQVKFTAVSGHATTYAIFQNEFRANSFHAGLYIDAGEFAEEPYNLYAWATFYGVAKSIIFQNCTFKDGLSIAPPLAPNDKDLTRPSSQFAFLNGKVINNLTGVETETGNVALVGIESTETWVSIIGTELTGFGGAVNNFHVHFMYMYTGADRNEMSYCQAHGTSGQMRFGFMANINPAGKTSGGDFREMKLIVLTDNFGQDCNYMIDVSGSSSLPDDSRILEGYFARNVINGTPAGAAGFIVTLALYDYTLINGYQGSSDWNNQVFANIGTQVSTDVRIDRCSGYGSQMYLFAKTNVNGYELGSRIITDNQIYAPNRTTEVGQYGSSYLTTGDYFDNVFDCLLIDPLVYYDWDTPGAENVTTFNADVNILGYASEAAGVTDFQDAANANFLPVGYGSSVPTISKQPVNTTIAEGERAVFYIDSAQADSYQVEVNTGSGYVNVASSLGGNNPVFTTGAQTVINSGDLYRYKLTNDAGTTTSTAATLTVSSGSQTLTLDGTNWMTLPDVALASDDTLTIEFKTSVTGQYQCLTSGDEVGTRLLFQIINTNTFGFTTTYMSVAIDETPITNGQSSLAYQDGEWHIAVITVIGDRVVTYVGNNNDSNRYWFGSLRNLNIERAAGNLFWAIDSGSTTVDDSTPSGTNLTYVNVDAGDWS